MRVERECTILPNREGKNQSRLYAFFTFPIKVGLSSLSVKVSFSSVNPSQLPFALFDPSGHIRVLQAPEGGIGKQEYCYHLSSSARETGTVSGPLQEGEWKGVIFKRRFVEPISVLVTLEGKEGVCSALYSSYSFPNRILGGDGWYEGELHVHSNHSTGRDSVSAIFDEAQNVGLDFISLTDHFTSSHWADIDRTIGNRPLICLQSMELSGNRGHAGLQGISSWCFPFVDENEELCYFLGIRHSPTMNDVADKIHNEGGLFAVNHPLSGLVGWRYHTFDMTKADLLEIWCTSDRETTFLYPTLWDSYLARGYRLIGVGSSDSHKVSSHPTWQLGLIRTIIHASEFSQRGLLDGLKRGEAYVAMGVSRLSFSALVDGNRYPMGSCVPVRHADFEVEIRHHPSGNLFIMVDGQIHDIIHFPEGDDIYRFSLESRDFALQGPVPSFVRLEYHEDLEKARYFGMAFRDWRTMRLLSNPIWLKG